MTCLNQAKKTYNQWHEMHCFGLKGNLFQLHLFRYMEIVESIIIFIFRALEMIEKFFSNVVADHTCQDNLKKHIEAAYAATLKQYHSWIIQKTFSVRFSP